MSLQSLREEQQCKEQQVEKEYQERVEAALARFKECLAQEFGADTLEELQARFAANGRGEAAVTLHYRGHTGSFADFSLRGRAKQTVLEWAQNIDTLLVKNEEVRRYAKEALLQELPDVTSAMTLRTKRQYAASHNLLHDPDVAPALAAAEERVIQTELKAEEEHKRRHEEEVQTALEKIGKAQTRRELGSIRDDLRWAYNDGRIIDAIDAAVKWLDAQEEYREACRVKAERERFFPFVYYQVEYALVAEDEQSLERYLDTRWVSVLLPQADASGWWYPLHGKPFKLTHPVRVERVVVLDVEHIPDGCPCEQTEWGAIRVPPAGCEGLDNGMLS